MRTSSIFLAPPALKKGTKARFGIVKVVWYNDEEEEEEEERKRTFLGQNTPVIPSGTVSAHFYFLFVDWGFFVAFS
jgi:hypothetical protein